MVSPYLRLVPRQLSEVRKSDLPWLQSPLNLNTVPTPSAPPSKFWRVFSVLGSLAVIVGALAAFGWGG